MIQTQYLKRTRTARYAFTLVELLVVIAIIAILAALLLSSLAPAKLKGQQITCLNNMHQIGVASEMYCQENQDRLVPMARLVTPYPASLIVPYPPHVWWPDSLKPLMSSDPKVFSCPNVPPIQAGIRLTNLLGIGMNFSELGVFPENVDPRTGPFVTTGMVANPSATIIFGDAAYVENYDETNADLWVADTDRKYYIWQGFGVWLFEVPNARNDQWTRNAVRVINRHKGKANCAFVDGHALAMKTSELGWQYPKGDPNALWDR